MSTSSPLPPHPHEPSSATEPEEERPAPKSPYARMTKQNSSVRNIVWALALTMLVVVVVAVLFFGVGNDLGREVPETSRLDVGESAERAQESAGFPIAVPQLDEEWVPRDARYDASSAQWEVRYTSPAGSLVSMIESDEVDAPMLSSAVPGAQVQEEFSIGGAACQELLAEGSEGSAPLTALSCAGDGWGILVHGEDAQQVRVVTEAAVADIAAG